MRCDLAQQWFPNCVSQANIKNVGSLSSLHPVLRVTGHTVYRTRNNRSCVLVCVRACVYVYLQQLAKCLSGWLPPDSSIPCCPQRP